MVLQTKFTELVGCKVPIQQAGGWSLPGLTSAVANAGALGMISMTGVPIKLAAERLEAIGKQTNGAFGVNFIPPLMDRADLLECSKFVAGRSKLVEYFYAWPDAALIDLVHAGGSLAAWQVGSVDEATAAAEAGCDLIVAQGIEAGGHVRGRIGLLPLLSEVLDTVDLPIVAAGGIGSARAMAGALAAGASAVRVGTRFVAAQECEAHPDYVKRLIEGRAEDTVLTDKFAGGWPTYAPHRVLRSSLEAAEAFHGDLVGEVVSAISGKKLPLYRLEGDFIPTVRVSGRIEAMPHWAGESVGGVTKVLPAAEIVRELAEGAEKLLRRWAK
jgi:nitronate monooxygenase